MGTKHLPKTWGTPALSEGGHGVGASPGRQPRRGLHAEERTSQAQKPRQCRECRGVPPLVLWQPRCATNAPSGGTLSHEQWAQELQTQREPLCKRMVLVFTTSKHTAGLGMGPWSQHPHVLLGTWWWSGATVPCQGAAASWQFEALPQSQRSCQNRGVQQKRQGGSSQHEKFQGPRIILWICFGMLQIRLCTLYLLEKLHKTQRKQGGSGTNTL